MEDDVVQACIDNLMVWEIYLHGIVSTPILAFPPQGGRENQPKQKVTSSPLRGED
jgi:hypothetical protein